MIDRTASLVDIMSLMFVISLIAFVMSTEGASENGAPLSFFRMTLTPLNVNTDVLSVNVQSHTKDTQRKNDYLQLVLYFKVDGEFLTASSHMDSVQTAVQENSIIIFGVNDSSSKNENMYPVSYTHLTLPTIYSV